MKHLRKFNESIQEPSILQTILDQSQWWEIPRKLSYEEEIGIVHLIGTEIEKLGVKILFKKKPVSEKFPNYYFDYILRLNFGNMNVEDIFISSWHSWGKQTYFSCTYGDAGDYTHDNLRELKLWVRKKLEHVKTDSSFKPLSELAPEIVSKQYSIE